MVRLSSGSVNRSLPGLDSRSFSCYTEYVPYLFDNTCGKAEIVLNKVFTVEIFQRAKENLDGSPFRENWLMMTLVSLIVGVLAAAAGASVAGIVLLLGPLAFGTARVSVNVARGGRAHVRELFSGFDECFGKSIGLYLITLLFTFLWSLLFVIPGIVKSYSYAMAPFIQQDSPYLGWKECLDASRSMMKGHKAQLFLIDLAVAGVYALVVLAFVFAALFLPISALLFVPFWIVFGAASFFVTAFLSVARAVFYDAYSPKEFLRV